ncbi:MAG: hypothetical protein COT73_03925 [Bdellovibrio sp. CG10_big_fil_rev_8_21_14_0_10_47_8]|nr:MAG: hypothetical protein COT73_03925 [Bdellovibrio sp. CG10_big_fil_rev_8_21_14_0_10_47_8]
MLKKPKHPTIWLALFAVTIMMLSGRIFAAESTDENSDKPSPSAKITTRDAKKICKDQGKKGAELIQCMKKAKGETDEEK